MGNLFQTSTTRHWHALVWEKNTMLNTKNEQLRWITTPRTPPKVSEHIYFLYVSKVIDIDHRQHNAANSSCLAGADARSRRP